MGTLVEQHGKLKFRRSFSSYFPLISQINIPFFFSIIFGDKLLKPSFHFMWIFPVVAIVTSGSFFLIGLYKIIKNPYVLILDSKGITNKTIGFLHSEKVAWESIDKIDYVKKNPYYAKKNAQQFIGISLRETGGVEYGAVSKRLIKLRMRYEKQFGYPIVIILSKIKGEKENLLDEILAYQQRVNS